MKDRYRPSDEEIEKWRDEVDKNGMYQKDWKGMTEEQEKEYERLEKEINFAAARDYSLRCEMTPAYLNLRKHRLVEGGDTGD